jgi:hypothetical protein
MLVLLKGKKKYRRFRFFVREDIFLDVKISFLFIIDVH